MSGKSNLQQDELGGLYGHDGEQGEANDEACQGTQVAAGED